MSRLYIPYNPFSWTHHSNKEFRILRRLHWRSLLVLRLERRLHWADELTSTGGWLDGVRLLALHNTEVGSIFNFIWPARGFRCVSTNFSDASLVWAGMNFMVNTVVIIRISMRCGVRSVVYEKSMTGNLQLISGLWYSSTNSLIWSNMNLPRISPLVLCQVLSPLQGLHFVAILSNHTYHFLASCGVRWQAPLIMISQNELEIKK